MEGVIRDSFDKIEKQLAVDLIKQVSMEMTQAKVNMMILGVKQLHTSMKCTIFFKVIL